MWPVAVDVAAVFADVPPELLALLGCQPALPPFTIFTPALQFLFAPKFSLAPEFALLVAIHLLAFHALRLIPSGPLGLGRKACS